MFYDLIIFALQKYGELRYKFFLISDWQGNLLALIIVFKHALINPDRGLCD